MKINFERPLITKSCPLQTDTIAASVTPKVSNCPAQELIQPRSIISDLTTNRKTKFVDTLNFDSISPADLEIPEFHNSIGGKDLQKSWEDSIPLKQYGIGKELQNVIETGANDVISFALNPVTWDTNDLINLAVVTSGTMMFFFLDKEIHKNINNGGTPSNSDLIKFGHFYGETHTTEFAALGIEAFGIVFNDKKAMKLGLELYESYFIANNITGLLKYSIGRSRPSEGNGPYEFKTFDRGKRLCALPSGHATLAFSMSTVLASYTDDDHLKIIIYIPALITGFARIYENYHWASDVFLGAAVGHFVGKFITSRHNLFGYDDIHFNIDHEGRLGFHLVF